MDQLKPLNPRANAISPARLAVLHSRIIDALFKKLALMYGTRWTALWEGIPLDAVKAEWQDALESVHPEAMDQALNAIVRDGKPFPPALPEFVAAARSFDRHLRSMYPALYVVPTPQPQLAATEACCSISAGGQTSAATQRARVPR